MKNSYSCVNPIALAVAFLMLTAMSPVLAQDTTTDRAMIERIHQVCERAFPADEPGAAVIAVLDGKVVFRRAYGKASLELDVAMRPEMVFCLASVTKTITATAVMALVEDGKLSLTDPAAKYLPDLSLDKRIQIQHLLSHTSGIPDYPDIPGFGMDHIWAEITSDELVKGVRGQELKFEPGSKFGYSNTNYALLAKLVEIASDASWEDFVTQRIFEPAGMKHSRYGGHDRVIPGAVIGYAKEGEKWKRSRALSYSRGYGLGGIFSSVDDLVAFDASLRKGKILKKETRARMYEPFTLTDGTKSPYALGWGSRTDSGRLVVSHGGAIFGWNTQFTRVPDSGIVVAVLTNREPSKDNPRAVGQLAGKISLEVSKGLEAHQKD